MGNSTFPHEQPSISHLSTHNCKSVNIANSFPFTDPSSIASTSATIPPSSTIAFFPSWILARLLRTTIAFSAKPVPSGSFSNYPTLHLCRILNQSTTFQVYYPTNHNDSKNLKHSPVFPTESVPCTWNYTHLPVCNTQTTEKFTHKLSLLMKLFMGWFI